MSEKFLVTRQDWEAFVETVDARTYGPTNSSCWTRANFKLECGVDAAVKVNTINVTPKGNFYGRSGDWTHVEIKTWIWENTTLTGKGSRGEQASQEIKEIMSLLGNFEG